MEYLSIRQAAGIAGTTWRTISGAIKSGDLTAKKFPGVTLIPRAEFDQWRQGKVFRQGRRKKGTP